MGDVSSKLHRELGFEWRPIQKSSLLNTLCKNMKKCRTFVKSAIKANLVTPDDLVTLFYDHVPLNTNAPSAFMPHLTAVISPNTQEVFIQTPTCIEELTKQSISGLLDICAEIGCNVAYMAIKNTSCEETKKFVQYFMSIGFQLVPPQKANMEGYLFMGFEL